MAHRFLSPSWLQEAQRLLASSHEFRRALAGQSGHVLAEVTDAPGGHPILLSFEFHDGVLKRAEASRNGHSTGEPAHLHITGTYDTFVKLQKGELTLQAAYFQRKLRLKGDFQRAMRFAPAFLAYHDIVRHVETNY